MDRYVKKVRDALLNEKGVSMIEVLVSLAILSFVFCTRFKLFLRLQ